MTNTSHPPSSHDTNTSHQPFTLSDTLKEAIDHWLAKYPSNQRQSAIIPALLTAQRHYEGWLPQQVIDAVADHIGMSRVTAYEVATFYSMLELKPIGRHKISICTNVSCMLNGSDQLMDHVQKKLNIKCGETTPDQRITLREVECLGACTRAPVMLVNDTYHENINIEAIDAVLDKISKEEI